MAVCGMKCVNVKVNTISIRGIYFSYDNKPNMEKNFLTAISNIQSILKIWRLRNLILESKIIVFKTLDLSKIIHLCLASAVPKQIIEEIKNIQKHFLWNQSTPKIKHSTLYNSFATGGLTNVDINTKIASLQ